MASFSRGCLLSLRFNFSQLPAPLRQSVFAQFRSVHQLTSHISPRRTFTTSSTLSSGLRKVSQKASPAPRPSSRPTKTPPPPPSSTHKKPTIPPTSTTVQPFLGADYARLLALRPHETVLYSQAPAKVFTLLCWGVALGCFVAGSLPFNDAFLRPPQGLQRWAFVGLGVCSILCFAIGLRSISQTGNLVHRLAAVPKGGPDRPRIEIEVVAQHVVPFRRPKEFSVRLQDVYLSRKVVPYLLEQGRVRPPPAASGPDEAGRRRFAPLRTFSQFIFVVFDLFRKVNPFNTDRFLYLAVKGKGAFKLDPNGFFEEQGRSIDRLFPVK